MAIVSVAETVQFAFFPDPVYQLISAERTIHSYCGESIPWGPEKYYRDSVQHVDLRKTVSLCLEVDVMYGSGRVPI